MGIDALTRSDKLSRCRYFYDPPPLSPLSKKKLLVFREFSIVGERGWGESEKRICYKVNFLIG